MALQDIDTRHHGASPYSASIHPSKCRPGARLQFGTPAPKARTNLAQGAAKLAFLAGITVTVFLAWQGITLHFQQFSVRPDSTPVATAVARWVHNWAAALKRPPAPIAGMNSTFAAESRMSARELVDRWTPDIAQASQRFAVPARWIRAVVQMESGGRTMSSPSQPITSHAGAMGVMQLMPGTYAEMRVQYHLGSNPYDPRDNIYAGAAYLHWLYKKYGYPTMFAAYNDGPGHLEERLVHGGLLPAETRNYVSHIVKALGGAGMHLASTGGATAMFTRPNGKSVTIDLSRITSVRIPFPGEYASGVHTVITAGDVHQGVRESYEAVKKVMLDRGELGSPINAVARDSRSAHHGATRLAATHRVHHRGARSRIAQAKRRTRHSGGEVADASPVHIHPIAVRRRS